MWMTVIFSKLYSDCFQENLCIAVETVGPDSAVVRCIQINRLAGFGTVPPDLHSGVTWNMTYVN